MFCPPTIPRGNKERETGTYFGISMSDRDQDKGFRAMYIGIVHR
jgi:hypothetical protein